MEKVYVLTSQTLMLDSSYYDVVGASKELNNVAIMLQEEAKGFLESIDQGNYNPSFTSSNNIEFEEEEGRIKITDCETGMFHLLEIQETNLY